MSGSDPPAKGPIRWPRIIAGIAVILFLATPCLIGAIVTSVGGNYILRDNIVAEGRAPGALSFDSGRERYVVALSAKPDGVFFDGLSRTERRRRFRVRESDVSRPGARSPTRTAPPRTETPLMVHAANTPLRYLTWGLLLGVFVFAGLGTLLILRGTVWRKARPSDPRSSSMLQAPHLTSAPPTPPPRQTPPPRSRSPGPARTGARTASAAAGPSTFA